MCDWNKGDVLTYGFGLRFCKILETEATLRETKINFHAEKETHILNLLSDAR